MLRLMRKQQGVTLVELMISIVIGLLITWAVLAMFISMVYANTTQMKAIRLNQELRSVMTAMVRDIRRAGHNQLAANAIGGANPYALFDTSTAGQIHIAYDLANDGAVETFGYQRDAVSGSIQGCKSTTAACSNWENLTDPSLTNITALTFTADTVMVGGLNQIKVNIRLTGNLRADTTFSRTLEQTVEVRN